MKIVINRCYGGYDLSPEAVYQYVEAKGIVVWPYMQEDWHHPLKRLAEIKSSLAVVYYFYEDLGDNPDFPDGLKQFDPGHIPRDDPLLVKIVEELGHKADGPFAKLKVVEIPDGVDWMISDDDGMEIIEEEHRSWS